MGRAPAGGWCDVLSQAGGLCHQNPDQDTTNDATPGRVSRGRGRTLSINAAGGYSGSGGMPDGRAAAANAAGAGPKAGTALAMYPTG